MCLLKLREKEHNLCVVMFIGGHYLKCFRATAVSVQCKVGFIDYICLCVSTEIISVSNLWGVLTSVVQMGKKNLYVQCVLQLNKMDAT